MVILALLFACSDYNLNTGDSDNTIGDSDLDTEVDTEVETDLPDEDTDVEDPLDEDFPPATEPMYLNTADSLFTWDAQSGDLRRIGAFIDANDGTRCTDMVDIAIDLGGRMYGTCDKVLLRIDPNDASTTYVQTFNDRYMGLTFISDGRLVLGGTGIIRMWDRTTLSETVIYDDGEYETGGDLVGLPDGKLYWAVKGNDDLVTLDPNTGRVTYIGGIGTNQSRYTVYGLGYTNGQLYAFTGHGEAVIVNTSTGRGQTIADMDYSWWGAATNPVLWE